MFDDYQTWRHPSLPAAYLKRKLSEKSINKGYSLTEDEKISHPILPRQSLLENEIVIHPRCFHLGCGCSSTRHHHRISSRRKGCIPRSAADYWGHQKCGRSFILPLRKYFNKRSGSRNSFNQQQRPDWSLGSPHAQWPLFLQAVRPMNWVPFCSMVLSIPS